MNSFTSFIAAQATILAIWAGMWLVFFGWGSLALAGLGCRRDDFIACVIRPWVGIAAAIAFLQLWHAAFAIDTLALQVFVAVGLAGTAILGRKCLVNGVAAARAHGIEAVAVAVLVIWMANRSLNSQQYPDQGLYYMNAIRWATDFPLVLGLGNLHDRLAFNNANFLLHALFDQNSWRGYSSHLVNGFFAALSMPIIVQGAGSILDGGLRRRQLGLFLVALVFLVTDGASDRRISSACTDYPAVLLVTVAAWRWLAAGLLPEEAEPDRMRWNLVVFALLTAAAVTIKTIVIFFVIFSFLAIAAYAIWRCRQGEYAARDVRRWAALMFFCGAVLIGPWMVRGYALSGSPVFPSSIGRIEFDWSVSPKAATNTRLGILAYARSSYLNRDAGYQPGWGWVRDWMVQVVLIRAPLELVLPAVISVAAGAFWLTYRRTECSSEETKHGRPQETNSNLVPYVLISVYLLSLFFWFIMAPSARMGSFAWWGLAGTTLGLASRSSVGRLLEGRRKLCVALLLGFLMLPTLHKAVLTETRYRKNPNLPELGKHFYHFHPLVLPSNSSGFPPIPTGEVVAKTTNSGLSLYAAAIKPDGAPGLVWDSPLPTAWIFDPRLTERSPGNLARGFRITPELKTEPD